MHEVVETPLNARTPEIWDDVCLFDPTQVFYAGIFYLLSYHHPQVKKFDLKVASAGTIESFVQAPAGKDAQLGGQALLQKLEADLEALESHLVELNTYNERLTSEYNEKVRYCCVVVIPKASCLSSFFSPVLQQYVN